MKKISYKFNIEANYGTEENSKCIDTFLNKTLICHTDEEYEENLLIAQQEAYLGEYTVEDDDIEKYREPTQLDRIEAQIAYLAMMGGHSEILEV